MGARVVGAFGARVRTCGSRWRFAAAASEEEMTHSMSPTAPSLFSSSAMGSMHVEHPVVERGRVARA